MISYCFCGVFRTIFHHFFDHFSIFFDVFFDIPYVPYIPYIPDMHPCLGSRAGVIFPFTDSPWILRSGLPPDPLNH